MVDFLVESCKFATQMLGQLLPAAYDSSRFLGGNHQVSGMVGQFKIEKKYLQLGCKLSL
jgi:hypothetical protein